jgi:sec-independent protein translocase protein TatA
MLNMDKTLIIVLILALIIIGPTQLPKLAKMFGKSAKALRDGVEGKADDEDARPVAESEPSTSESSAGLEA